MKGIIVFFIGVVCFMAYNSVQHFRGAGQYFSAGVTGFVALLLVATLLLLVVRGGEKIIDRILDRVGKRSGTIIELGLD